MNKKVLSIAAAGFIAAGLIGCGGGGGSSSNNNTQPTSVKGVDGYVMNAKVSVTYWDTETNSTKTTNVDVSNSYYLTVDSATNEPKAGKAIYNLDLNSTVLNNLVYISMTQQPQGKLADGSVYAPSFYDADGNGEYNSSIDVPIPAGVKLSAPKGFSVITPISTLIANQVKATLLADKNETNLTNVVDAYTKDIANALGVDESTIKNVDPVNLKTSNNPIDKAYVVANAFAGAIIAGNGDLTKAFNALKSAPKPKTAADVIANLASAAKAAGTTNVVTVLNQVKNLIQTSSANLDALVQANLDKTRTSSVNNRSLVLTPLKSSASGDFNISNIDIYAGANGYKLSNSSLNALTFYIAPNDANITNKTFKFVIRVADPRNYNAQDANVSSLTVEVPFEINSTNNTPAVSIPQDAKLRFEGMDQNGTKIISGELNASAIIFSNNNKKIALNGNTVTIKAADIISAVDSNQSNAFFGGSFPNKILEIQAGIIPEDGSAVFISNGNVVLMPKDQIVSIGGYINDTVDSMISFNAYKTLVADVRGGVTRANAEGNASVSIQSTAGNTIGQDQRLTNVGQVLEVDFNNSNATTADANVTLKFTDSSIDSAFEANATVGSIEFNDTLGGALSINHTSLKDLSTTGDGTDELNLTVDYSKINALSLTGAHPTALLTYKATDEFGATGNEQNVTLWFNRAPYIDATAQQNLGDFNSTKKLNKAALVKDKDGLEWGNGNTEYNITLTASSAPDLNYTGSTLVLDNNGTLTGLMLCDASGCTGAENNYSVSIDPKTGDFNISFVDTNASSGVASLSKDVNLTFTIKVKDKYGAIASKEINVTAKKQ